MYCSERTHCGSVGAFSTLASILDFSRLIAVRPGDQRPVHAPDWTIERRKRPLAAGLTESAHVDCPPAPALNEQAARQPQHARKSVAQLATS
jgi:hypothetical protein